MPGDKRLEGRRAALAVLSKHTAKPEPQEPTVSLDALTETLQKLVQGRPEVAQAFTKIEAAIKGIKLQSEAVDFKPLVQAIASIKPQVEFDTAAIVQAIEAQTVEIDLSKVEDELVKIRSAIEGNNQTLQELVKVAKSKRVVKYDSSGRITEIAIQEN